MAVECNFMVIDPFSNLIGNLGQRLEELLEGRWPIRFAAAEERHIPAVEDRLPCPSFPITRYLTYPW